MFELKEDSFQSQHVRTVNNFLFDLSESVFFQTMPVLETMLAVCYGCRSSIDDRYYLMAVDRTWHLSCLKCFDCGMSLEQERTCFARHGQIFCRDDYIK